ncbi:MAG: polysaccharide biosynthesis/export family protein [Bacteroidota bacterium]
MKYFWGCLILALSLSTGCISNKQTVILQDRIEAGEVATSDSLAAEYSYSKPAYHLQANDVLDVKVKSVDGRSAGFLNVQGGGNLLNQLGLYINGYSIDDSGYIYLPAIGKQKVGGLTVNQARSLIQGEVDQSLRNATVFVTLVSFKVSVLGEVKKPGQFFIYQNQVTILDALAQAGDITEFGNRSEVTLVRQIDEGNQAVKLDLTSPKVIASRYYYLQPNDVVYVEPLKTKNARSNLVLMNVFRVIFAAASTAAVIIRFSNR